MTLAAIAPDVRAITGPAVPRVNTRGPGRAVYFGPMMHPVLRLPVGPESPQAPADDPSHESRPRNRKQDSRQADADTFDNLHWSPTLYAGRNLPYV
jgi:hypothetical protein